MRIKGPEIYEWGMQDKVDALCLERDRLNGEERLKAANPSQRQSHPGCP